MSKKDWIEVGVSLMSGAGIGAALMYLFDPDLGDKRRQRAAELAGDYASSAGETLGAGWEHARSLAGNIGSAAADRARYIGRQSRNLGSSAADYAGDFLDDASGHIRGWGNSAARSARGAVKSARHAVGYEEPSHAGTIAGITTGAIGALALGAGLMFLLDPSQGRRRRAIIRDKTTSAAHRSARYARSTGRHIANKATGLAHEAGSYASSAVSAVKGAVGAGTNERVDDMTLAERARAAIGRLSNTGNVSCRVEGGRAILTGNIPASGVERVVAVVGGLTGINGVDNRLDVRDSIASI